jgi:hypothetical protein
MTADELRADHDFWCAFHQAQHDTFGSMYSKIDGRNYVIDHVVDVVAYSDGMNDERYWLALCKLDDGRYIKMFAGCDYPGWDCQASGNIEYYDTMAELMSINTLTAAEADRICVERIGG